VPVSPYFRHAERAFSTREICFFNLFSAQITSHLINGRFAVASVMVCLPPFADVRCLGAFLAPLKGADHWHATHLLREVDAPQQGLKARFRSQGVQEWRHL
jgi:hypothetical protein